MSWDAVEEVGVVVDAELVGDGEQQGVGGGDRFVVGEFLDQLLGLSGVGFAEPGGAAVEVPDLVLAVAGRAEVGPVQVGDDREDAAADRDPRPALVAGGLPRLPEPLDLFGLELVERHPGVIAE